MTAPVVATAQEIQATGTAVLELRIYDRVMTTLMTKWQLPAGYGLAEREGAVVV